jgi:CheY-like chemotaxis protein
LSDTPQETNNPLALPGKRFAGQESDALRRHVCQILGFDIALIDIFRGNNIDNLITFFAEEHGNDITLNDFLDENNEPLSNTNSTISQQVRQSLQPHVGQVLLIDDNPQEEELRFPYIVVPISDGQGAAARAVKGLIRVICFDNARKIETADISNVRLVGQHLASRIPHLGDAEPAGRGAPQAADPAQPELIVVAHLNRATRRRLARTLSADGYHIIEAEDGGKVMQSIMENEVGLLVIDSQMPSTAGEMLCKSLKAPESDHKHVSIVVVTNDADTNAKVEGLNSGADDCVSDTCIDAELLARVKSLLRLKKTERELGTQLKLLEDYAQRLEYASDGQEARSGDPARPG